jgi:hypothetical protein
MDSAVAAIVGAVVGGAASLVGTILVDWWHRAGKPTLGLVFPKRKGFAPDEDEREAAPEAHEPRGSVPA